MADFAVHARDLGAVRELTLSHPARLNALNDPLLRQLAAELDRAVTDGARAIVLRGEGERAFSSGYDLNALPEVSPGALPDVVLEQTLAHIDALPVPIVALLNGHAFGGGLELAAACDFRIGLATAKLGMPPAKLGIVYAPRGLLRFVALMGPSRAKRLFLAAEQLDGTRAAAHGLLDEAHASLADAERSAHELAQQLAANAPKAVAGMRRIFRALEESPQLALEPQRFEALRREAFASEDAKEGREAFLQKRPPRFSGR